MGESAKPEESMSSEEALALIRAWQSAVKGMPPAARSKFMEDKLAALGPDAQRLARRILADLLKPPRAK